MNLSLPRLTRPLPLKDFLPEVGDQVMHVWVNPPDVALESLVALERAAKENPDNEPVVRALLTWYAECWSQHGDPATHWTFEEVRALVDDNPALYAWAARSTIDMLAEHLTETTRQRQFARGAAL